MTEAEQNRLITDNLSLVTTIAQDFRGGQIEFEELRAIGNIGLTNAARLFDRNLGQFDNWAASKIRLEIFNAVERAKRQFYPKETDEALFGPAWADSIEKIYEIDSWGNRGNANAISERWTKLDASPEELADLYDDLQDKQAKFDAAFISLTGNQRKLVSWVYLDDKPRPIVQAARDLGVSYAHAIRLINKALKTMRAVITRMESNKTSGGNNANGHPSNTGRHGCVSGNVAA